MNNIKTFLVSILLLTSLQSFGQENEKVKKKSRRVKARKQMSHFAKTKKDKKQKHNGSSYYMKQNGRTKDDGDGFLAKKRKFRR